MNEISSQKEKIWFDTHCQSVSTPTKHIGFSTTRTKGKNCTCYRFFPCVIVGTVIFFEDTTMLVKMLGVCEQRGFAIAVTRCKMNDVHVMVIADLQLNKLLTYHWICFFIFLLKLGFTCMLSKTILPEVIVF